MEIEKILEQQYKDYTSGCLTDEQLASRIKQALPQRENWKMRLLRWLAGCNVGIKFEACVVAIVCCIVATLLPDATMKLRITFYLFSFVMIGLLLYDAHDSSQKEDLGDFLLRKNDGIEGESEGGGGNAALGEVGRVGK